MVNIPVSAEEMAILRKVWVLDDQHAVVGYTPEAKHITEAEDALLLNVARRMEVALNLEGIKT